MTFSPTCRTLPETGQVKHYTREQRCGEGPMSSSLKMAEAKKMKGTSSPLYVNALRRIMAYLIESRMPHNHLTIAESFIMVYQNRNNSKTSTDLCSRRSLPRSCAAECWLMLPLFLSWTWKSAASEFWCSPFIHWWAFVDLLWWDLISCGFCIETFHKCFAVAWCTWLHSTKSAGNTGRLRRMHLFGMGSLHKYSRWCSMYWGMGHWYRVSQSEPLQTSYKPTAILNWWISRLRWAFGAGHWRGKCWDCWRSPGGRGPL